jgi:4-amino-4-deoxy-L-arabinose transferase-like glycosyltransferase
MAPPIPPRPAAGAAPDPAGGIGLPAPGAPDPPLPRGALLAVLALAFALQLWTLGRVHGYPIADSVEYLERAELFVQGRELDAGSVRSFAFSALLVPLVAAFRALGDDAVLGAARLLVMLLGLATIAVTARLAARVAGRGAALVAAFALAVNPVFLRWSVEPLSGVAAAFFVALAFLALARPGAFRRGLAVGAALGAAFLMAFQSLAILACAGGLLLLRDRWKGRAHTLGWVAAIALALLAQATLDQVIYGSFGSSVSQYALENFGGTISTKIYKLGQVTGSETLKSWGFELYNSVFTDADVASQAVRTETTSKMPRSWYVTHLHTHLLAWPLLALGALGVLRASWRPRWAATILLVTVAVNTWVMSDKGWKDYRLWLPLLPAVATFVGAGYGLLAAPGPARALRRGALLVLLALSAKLSADMLARTNLAKHGGYWDAMAFVAAERERAGNEPELLGAGYHWATLFRDGGPGLEQRKLPHPLYAWPADEEARILPRADVLPALGELDWFVSHQQLVEQDPAIAAALAERFEVVAAFHDGAAYEDLAPVLVFRRAPDGAEARRLYTVRREGTDPGALQARIAHPRSVDLRRRFEGDVTDQLVLLGWDAEVLPGSANVAWLSLHWYAGPTNGRDYTIGVRVTDPSDRTRQVNRAPCWGAVPTSAWETGWVVSDGFPIPLDAVGDHPPLGGAYRRGDLIPLRLWIAAPLYEANDDGVVRHVGGLAPFHPSGRRPVHKEKRGARVVSDEGWIFSKDTLVLVGGFLAPVPPAAWLPDDGRPLADP